MMTNTPRFLIVEDEEAIRAMLHIILTKEGWTDMTSVATYDEARKIVEREPFDFYLLDIMLPDGDGTDLVQPIRTQSDAPIFFLTAKTSDADLLTGFMKGADDYVKKPFHPLELVARIQAQLNRSFHATDRARDVYTFGRCTLHVPSATLSVDSEPVELTGLQFRLLHYFAQHAGHVLSKEQLYEGVWGERYVDDNTIMVHIRKLREKIERDPSRPTTLVTIRRLGYKLNTEHAE